ncbi:hypothetical protein PCE1_000589 [Barthelona sp. PCE]
MTDQLGMSTGMMLEFTPNENNDEYCFKDSSSFESPVDLDLEFYSGSENPQSAISTPVSDPNTPREHHNSHYNSLQGSSLPQLTMHSSSIQIPRNTSLPELDQLREKDNTPHDNDIPYTMDELDRVETIDSGEFFRSLHQKDPSRTILLNHIDTRCTSLQVLHNKLSEFGTIRFLYMSPFGYIRCARPNDIENIDLETERSANGFKHESRTALFFESIKAQDSPREISQSVKTVHTFDVDTQKLESDEENEETPAQGTYMGDVVEELHRGTVVYPPLVRMSSKELLGLQNRCQIQVNPNFIPKTLTMAEHLRRNKGGQLTWALVSYFDIRGAMGLIERAQHEPSLSCFSPTFTVMVENPFINKRYNNGTLVLFNLKAASTDIVLINSFAEYGDLREIRRAPRRKSQRFIEFYDSRNAAFALKAFSKACFNGKQLKIHSSVSGGFRLKQARNIKRYLKSDLIRYNVYNKYTTESGQEYLQPIGMHVMYPTIAKCMDREKTYEECIIDNPVQLDLMSKPAVHFSSVLNIDIINNGYDQRRAVVLKGYRVSDLLNNISCHEFGIVYYHMPNVNDVVLFFHMPIFIIKFYRMFEKLQVLERFKDFKLEYFRFQNLDHIINFFQRCGSFLFINDFQHVKAKLLPLNNAIEYQNIHGSGVRIDTLIAQLVPMWNFLSKLLCRAYQLPKPTF